MPNGKPTIHAVINGHAVSRGDVLHWEAKRLPKAAKKIGLPVPGGDLADATARTTARLSFGRRTTSICHLHVTGGTVATFVDWFIGTDREDYARSMIAANPDHFLIDTAPDGRQEVIETTGGSPLATQFFVGYQDSSSLVTPRDPVFAAEVAGVARTGHGLAIGGVRHEFRDTAKGFDARLCVEFPLLTAPHMVAAHRWHLACEFSNWIEAAFAG